MSPELHLAIEDLYVAFGDVPKPEVIEGCPCCIEQKGVDVLLSKSLRDIKPEELGKYAASALLTVGSLSDYRYLLPRILEILATDSGWWPDAEVVTQTLKRADFRDWSQIHREAVIKYFDAVFDDLLAANDDLLVTWEIDSWICALGHLFPSVRPYLERLGKSPAKVIAYYKDNSESLIKGRLSNAFWNEELPAYHEVLAWFESPEIKKMIKESYGL